jgi:hypothetical protein
VRALTKGLLSLAGMLYGAAALASVAVVTDATGTARPGRNVRLVTAAMIQQQPSSRAQRRDQQQPWLVSTTTPDHHHHRRDGDDEHHGDCHRGSPS